MRLALDPGQTTGIAYRGAEGPLRGVQWPGNDIAAVLEGLHSLYGLDEIVVENFRSRPGPAVNLSAPRVIGRIYAWAEDNDVPIVEQDPSWAKRVITKDRLRALGGWVRGQEHARDALRHLLYREHKLGEIDLPEVD